MTSRPKTVPRMTTDEEAEAFLEQDLSALDFSQFKLMRFEFEPRTDQLSMRLPQPLLDAVKAKADARGIPYTRFMREALETVLQRDSTARSIWTNYV